MNSVIIVAAGSGKRFGGKTPKQFLEINGKPLIIYTLERFEQCPLIDEIILVLQQTEIINFLSIAGKFGLTKLFKVIAGGETRAESVLNALNAIDSETAEIVAVHDGVRPLITTEEITKTVLKAKETGAACLVAPVNDTIKEISDEKIVRTISRLNLRRALTPQCFRYEILKRAFEENSFDEEITDECFLVEKLGIEVSVVEGSARNIKITHADDLALAELLLCKSEA